MKYYVSSRYVGTKGFGPQREPTWIGPFSLEGAEREAAGHRGDFEVQVLEATPLLEDHVNSIRAEEQRVHRRWLRNRPRPPGSLILD